MYTTADNVEQIINMNKSNPQTFSSDEKSDVQDIRDKYVDPEIDARLANEFNVPFKDHPDTPKMITNISTKMTTYLWVVFPGGLSDQFQFAQELWNQAMTALDGLESGDLDLHELQDELDTDGFEFKEGVKSESFYPQSIFLGDLDGPVFGDSYTNLNQ